MTKAFTLTMVLTVLLAFSATTYAALDLTNVNMDGNVMELTTPTFY